MYTDLSTWSHEVEYMYLERFSPEEPSDPTLLESGNVNVPTGRRVEVEGSDVVAVNCACELR